MYILSISLVYTQDVQISSGNASFEAQRVSSLVRDHARPVECLVMSFLLFVVTSLISRWQPPLAIQAVMERGVRQVLTE